MRKTTKILLLIFCAGILLTGIGAGVAFVEYSSFEYGGEHIINSQYATEKHTVSVPADSVKPFRLENIDNYYGTTKITYSDSLPENTIEWTVTYTSEQHKPSFYEFYEYEDPNFSGVLGISWHHLSNLKRWFDCKDLFLKDLKERKISSYRMEDAIQTEIRIASGLKDRIFIDDPYNEVFADTDFSEAETAPVETQWESENTSAEPPMEEPKTSSSPLPAASE